MTRPADDAHADPPEGVDDTEPFVEYVDPLSIEPGPCCENGECGREDCPNVEPRDTIETPEPDALGAAWSDVDARRTERDNQMLLAEMAQSAAVRQFASYHAAARSFHDALATAQAIGPRPNKDPS